MTLDVYSETDDPFTRLADMTASKQKSSARKEERVLEEWKQREAQITTQLIELENQVCSLRDKLDIVTSERNKLLKENEEVRMERREREMEIQSLRSEVRSFKYKEVKLLSHYNSLEDENTILQKQLSDLRKSQVESEIKNRTEVEVLRRKRKSPPRDTPNGSIQEVEIAQLEEEVARLKMLLGTKGDQVITLRGIVKSTKQTMDLALKNMQGKHDAEVQILLQNNNALRDEIKCLREGSANRGPSNELEELTKQIEFCEREKKTLMQLLYNTQEARMAMAKEKAKSK